MTRGAYEQLVTLLRMVETDHPPDEQVRRQSKGLARAIARFVRIRWPDSGLLDQARNVPPSLADPSASLAGVNPDPLTTVRGSRHEDPRTQGKD